MEDNVISAVYWFLCPFNSLSVYNTLNVAYVYGAFGSFLSAVKYLQIWAQSIENIYQ